MRVICAFLVSAGLAATARAAPPTEMRGLWVVRTALVSPQEVDQVVDRAKEGGFNALFVQVRGRGDAFYESRIVSRSPLLGRQPADFDPLARLVDRARSRGLQVHAWVNVLLTAHFGQPLPRDHVVSRHPEWLMVPRSAARAALSAKATQLPGLIWKSRDADVEGYYLSPSAEGVPEHLEAVVREVVRGYPVDGIHLDFIRYPGPEYDYSRAALEKFRRRQGGGDLVGGPMAAPPAWNDYRRGVLDRLAEQLVRAARAERPAIVVSAAVVPDEAAAVQHKFQDWPSWLRAGLLDALCPMTYTQDTRVFRAQLEQVRTHVRPGQFLWAGVGAYRLSVEGTAEKIRAARAAGAGGVVVFSHESLATGDWRRLREAAFTSSAPAAAVPASTGVRSSQR
jgi:uncharacterized lipoprotein YddW (UPF0748 family)